MHAFRRIMQVMPYGLTFLLLIMNTVKRDTFSHVYLITAYINSNKLFRVDMPLNGQVLSNLILYK